MSTPFIPYCSTYPQNNRPDLNYQNKCPAAPPKRSFLHKTIHEIIHISSATQTFVVKQAWFNVDRKSRPDPRVWILVTTTIFIWMISSSFLICHLTFSCLLSLSTPLDIGLLAQTWLATFAHCGLANMSRISCMSAVTVFTFLYDKKDIYVSKTVEIIIATPLTHPCFFLLLLLLLLLGLWRGHHD